MTDTTDAGQPPASGPKRRPRKSAITYPARRPYRKPGRPKPAGSTRLRMVELTLRTAHSINGTPYGPGKVLVREDVAAVLREQEQRVVEEVQRFEGTRAVLVGPRQRVIDVPYETFDASWAGPAPVIAGSISQTGKVGGF